MERKMSWALILGIYAAGLITLPLLVCGFFLLLGVFDYFDL
jgi:hypothetical protein